MSKKSSAGTHGLLARMQKKGPKTLLVLGIALLLCLASLALTVFLGYRHYQKKSYWEAEIWLRTRKEASWLTLQVEEELGRLSALAGSIADDLTAGDLEHRLLTRRLRQELDSHSDIFGLGAAYQAEAYKTGLALYAPSYLRDEQQAFKRVQIEDFYDYTRSPDERPDSPESSWYHQPLEQGAMWHELYFSTVAESFVIQYAVPFFRSAPVGSEDTPIGIVYANHSVETLSTFIDSLDLGEEGYCYLLSQKGEYIVHPDKSFFGKTIFEIAEELDNYKLYADGERIVGGEAFFREGIDPTSGRTAWMFYETIPGTNLLMGLVFDKNARSSVPNMTIRDMTWISLALVTWLCVFSALLFRIDRGTTRSLWCLITIIALLFTAEIGGIWLLAMSNPPHESHEIILTSQTSLHEYLNILDNEFHDRSQPLPLRIPTGLMIQSIKFDDVNEAAVAGYLWQKYPAGAADDIEKTFFFPDIIDEEAGNMEEVYRFTEGGTETIGWFFRTTLRQSFNFSKYPLDRAIVRIRIWPKSLNQPVVFVPDLDAYKFINPSQKPGLSDELLLEGWDIGRSFFSFQNESYNANFGSDRAIIKNNTPTLYFTMHARRIILSPVIAHAITLFVVTALMFGVLVVDAENAFNVLSYAAALFFVVAIAHVGLRGELEIAGVVYFESFYILIYLVILLISVNSILFYSPVQIPFVEYRDNLIPKLLYWPVVSGILLFITIATFYPPASEKETLEALRASPFERRTLSQAEKPERGVVRFTADGASSSEDDESSAILDRVTLNCRVSNAGGLTLDPSLAEYDNSFTQIKNLFVGLTRIDFNSGEVLPALAREWSVSDDGLEWTFVLRDDIPWLSYDSESGQTAQVTDFNGHPRFVSAHDVAYSIRRTLDPETQAPLANILYVIKHAEAVNTGQTAAEQTTQPAPAAPGVTVIDERTITFTLEHPAAYFPTILAHPVAFPTPEWAINEWGAQWTEVNVIHTSGPYLLAAMEADSRIQLIKNPRWVDAESVQIEVIEQQVIEDEQSALHLYEQHKLDTVMPNLLELERIQADLRLRKELTSFSTLSTDFLTVVQTKPPFHDVRVRRAFSAALDRQAIIYQDAGDIPATSFAPPGVFGASAPGASGQDFDPEAARASLQAFLEEKGFTLAEFNASYDIVLGYYESYTNMAETLRDMWREELGVEVRLEIGAWYEYDKHSPFEEMPHLYFDGWFADYPDEHNWLYAVFHSEGGLNLSRRNCADPNCGSMRETTNEFDRLTAEAAHTTDPATRRELYAEAEQILAVEEAAYIPLYHAGQAVLTKAWLTRNYPPDFALDFYNWKIDVEAQQTGKASELD
ncbi:MAG: hypothetical protein GY801_21290 [bacterium]|nr:hypothetical protein [bacterium]